MLTLNHWLSSVTLSLALVACSEEPSTNPSAAPATTPNTAADTAAGEAEFATSGTPAVLIAAGDIAGCTSSYRDEATAKLVQGISGTVITLGDNAYPDGTSSNYRNCYSPTWGQFKARTRPSPGNHDYHVSGAAAYFNYFGKLAGPCCRGYYFYTLGTWRIYSLNSEANRTAQLAWLKSDLTRNPAKCVLAYWHQPLYNGGRHPPSKRMYEAFAALYRAGAEVVLNGHDHNYQRFAPMNADGARRTNGVRQFVAGTGGATLYNFERSAPNLQVKYNGTRGVLRLKLYDGSYSWKFIPTLGTFSDAGSGTCH